MRISEIPVTMAGSRDSGSLPFAMTMSARGSDRQAESKSELAIAMNRGAVTCGRQAPGNRDIPRTRPQKRNSPRCSRGPLAERFILTLFWRRCRRGRFGRGRAVEWDVCRPRRRTVRDGWLQVGQRNVISDQRSHHWGLLWGCGGARRTAWRQSGARRSLAKVLFKLADMPAMIGALHDREQDR